MILQSAENCYNFNLGSFLSRDISDNIELSDGNLIYEIFFIDV